MTVEGGAVPALLLSEITAMIAAVTGEDEAWTARVGAASRLEADLQFESIEAAALGECLRQRYGDAIDLPAYLATLTLDELIALTVGDVVAYVAGQTGTPGSPS